MAEPRRALLMASGANRGAWYAGFPGPLADGGIDFGILAGVSAGGIAAAWLAAGDEEALIRSWRLADPWRVALHPWLAIGRRIPVDGLIRRITLRTMDVEAARTGPREVRLGAARIVRPGVRPRLELEVLSNRDAPDRETFCRMLRATAFVPWLNGFRTSVEIDGARYLDGGLVHRVPLSLIPRDTVDEIWVAACSPNGLRELEQELVATPRPERIVVVRPSEPLPVGRWTMRWERVERAIALGRRDMTAAVRRYREGG